MRTLKLVFVLLLLSAGGLARATSPAVSPDPRPAAMAVFQILQRQDWVALYSAVAMSEHATEGMPPRAEDFAADVRRGIGKGQATIDAVMGGMSDLAVGAADVQGDYATLPTSCTITLQGRAHAFRGTIHLIRRRHAWKWDLTFSDDAEAATSKALGDLIGKPVTAEGK